jgi:hypothetical protein
MSTHIRYHLDESGDTVDADYYCDGFCYRNDIAADERKSEGGAHPCPDWPDYSVYCPTCNTKLHTGLDEEWE